MGESTKPAISGVLQPCQLFKQRQSSAMLANSRCYFCSRRLSETVKSLWRLLQFDSDHGGQSCGCAPGFHLRLTKPPGNNIAMARKS